MTEEEINIEVTRLADAMTGKGFYQVNARAELRNHGAFSSISFAGYTKANSYNLDHHRGETIYAETIDEALTKAWAEFDKIKSLIEERTDTFRKKLAAHLEEARELGLEVEELNPVADQLEAMMKQLSEHIITDQTEPIAAE